MFSGCWKFNSDLSNWNTKNVKTFKSMFKECRAFNKNIGNWNFSSLLNANKVKEIFKNCNINSTTYSDFLISLNENNTIPSGLTGINWGDIRNINSGLVKYQSRAENARNNLTAGGKHIFNDGGLE